MNKNLIVKTIGLVLICESAAMLPSLFLALIYKEPDMPAFFYSIIMLLIPGTLLALTPVKNKDVGYREGFAIATSVWLVTALGGSIPFLLSGTLTSFYDAFFESMSGFTTTGASIIPDVEILPHGILFWRSFTQFLGGMGTIVLILALIPSLKIAAGQLFRAEFPGPSKSRVLPSILQTTRQLWKVYLLITLAEVLLLILAGMPIFDAFLHTFSSVATGGFSCKNASIGAYDSAVIEGIVIFFMVLCSINFALHINALWGNGKVYLRDSELRFYLCIMTAGILLIAFNSVYTLHQPLQEAIRTSLFTVTSVITTTGYTTADYNQWPEFSKNILFLLMFVGGCAGSTSGAIKSVRFLILFKSASRQLLKFIHPHAVVPIRLGREVVPEVVVENVHTFFFLYITIFAAASLCLASLGLDLVSAASAVAAALSSVGPGLGLVGPAANYSILPDSGKLLLTFCMLIGRLELYTVLVLFSTRFWRG